MTTPADVEFALPADALERQAMDFAMERLAALFDGAAGELGGLFVASRNAGSASALRFWADAQRSGVGLANPELFPWCLANAACGALARRFAITGPCTTWLGGDEALQAAQAAASAALAEGRITRACVVAVDFGSATHGAGRLRAWLLRREDESLGSAVERT